MGIMSILEMNHQAKTDFSTGLYNRNQCNELLQNEDVIREQTCLMIFDLNGLKKVNDTFGHEAGNTLIRCFAKLLQQQMPEQAFLGRYGGDEFVVYIKNAASDDAHRYMDEFQREISHLMMSGGEHVTVSASAGGVAFIGEGEDFVSLCRSADNMLYDVKRNGKGTFKIKGAKNM